MEGAFNTNVDDLPINAGKLPIEQNINNEKSEEIKNNRINSFVLSESDQEMPDGIFKIKKELKDQPEIADFLSSEYTKIVSGINEDTEKICGGDSEAPQDLNGGTKECPNCGAIYWQALYEESGSEFSDAAHKLLFREIEIKVERNFDQVGDEKGSEFTEEVILVFARKKSDM